MLVMPRFRYIRKSNPTYQPMRIHSIKREIPKFYRPDLPKLRLQRYGESYTMNEVSPKTLVEEEENIEFKEKLFFGMSTLELCYVCKLMETSVPYRA